MYLLYLSLTQIVVYQGNVDTILDVLLHINIKKLVVTNENRAQFFDLHDLMSEIIFNLVKKR
jgi:Mg2+/Co2+ transporter CorB